MLLETYNSSSWKGLLEIIQSSVPRAHRAMLGRVLNVTRDGDSRTSLDSLFQGLTSLTVKQGFCAQKELF